MRTFPRFLAVSAAIAICAELSGCMTPPPTLDLSREKASAAGHYKVAIVAPNPAPAVNQLHAWKVKLAAADGHPIKGAEFTLDGGMPQHGHGFPTKPRITREVEEGTYLLEGMKFSMTGWWDLKLGIRASEGPDAVTFNIVIDHAAQSSTPLRDLWSKSELGVLASMHIAQAGPRPVDPSNAYESRQEAAQLGKALFNDVRLSRDGRVSCASCHSATGQFEDGRRLGEGLATGKRRTMPIPGASHTPFLFWDGRKDSLWSQALGPMEDPAEHGGNRAKFVRIIQEHYAQDYRRAFAELPPLENLVDASPVGTESEKAAWAALPEKTRDQVNRVFANMGKAIAAYESHISYGPSRFDRYIDATLARDGKAQEILSTQEVRGLRAFLTKGQCVTCHHGPLMTDHAFHNTGVPPLDAKKPDRGRAEGVRKLMGDEFNCLGPYSDAKPQQCGELNFLSTDDSGNLAAFRTPSLRNVAARAPYMHAGQFASLEDVLRHYAGSPRAALGHSELARPAQKHAQRQPIRLSSEDIADLAAFLRTLNGPVNQPR